MQLPKLKMEGRSGCELFVEHNDGKSLIKKFSNSLTYNSRLIRQAEKQSEFYEKNNSMIFTTAKVYEVFDSNEKLAWFTMPYLFAEKYSDYLDGINLSQLKNIIQDIINYFQSSIDTAIVISADFNVISFKIDEIKNNINKNIIIEKGSFDKVFTYLQNNLPTKPLPIGNCHGDFTFSNMLFDDQHIFLLDFLDSFIESPIIDIVKLRQDTCYKWSIMLESDMPVYKSNKLIQIFNYIDNRIADYCDNKLKMNSWYTYLQAFNLVRIAPYLRKKEEVTFINNSLKSLLQ